MPTDKRPLKVFLCHASTDKPKVRELYRYLKRRGINPWFDEEHLVGGQDWQVEIPKALATSDAIIICLTKNSVDKEGYIQKEIKFALDKALEMPEGRIFLIPIKFEECEVPFTLSRFQWVDLTVESGYAKMMKALKFRASQLERSTVEVSKTDVEEENLAREKKEREAAERAEQERNEALVKQYHELKEKAARRYEKNKEKPVVVKPKTGSQIAYWISGFIVLVFGIIFLSSLNNPPATPQPTPENTQTQTIATPPQNTVEPSVTAAPESTSTPSVTLTPTPLPTEITDAKGITMRLVPEGEFIMGSEKGYTNEKPEHKVYLDTYYIDVYEVTNIRYKSCVQGGGCSLPNQDNSFTRSDYYGNPEFDNYPVIYIDWNQAKSYCEWRGASLPTEAQWEKAARGVDERTYPWGEGFDCNKANSSNCKKDTSPVGSYESGKSPYGIYDMAGNVWEWTADWFSNTYYQISPSLNPVGPEIGQYRILRGGAWVDYFGELTRSAARYSFTPDNYNYYFGFRCSKEAIP